MNGKRATRPWTKAMRVKICYVLGLATPKTSRSNGRLGTTSTIWAFFTSVVLQGCLILCPKGTSRVPFTFFLTVAKEIFISALVGLNRSYFEHRGYQTLRNWEKESPRSATTIASSTDSLPSQTA